MGHFERVARGKGRAGVQQCSKLARIEADADQMTQIQRCLAAMQETSQSRQQKKNAPTQMYAQNLGSKAVVVMQQSMATWMSKAKMTPQQASSSLAADAALLRFAIQGGMSFAHAGGVAAQHLATALQKAPAGYQVPNRHELTEWRLPKQLQDEYRNAAAHEYVVFSVPTLPVFSVVVYNHTIPRQSPDWSLERVARNNRITEVAESNQVLNGALNFELGLLDGYRFHHRHQGATDGHPADCGPSAA
jgi:hypothetical protein